MATFDRLNSGSVRARVNVKGQRITDTFDTVREARRWARDQERRVDLGTWVDPALGRTTVMEYATGWLDGKVDLRPRSRINVEGRLRNHILPRFGDLPLAQVQPADVRGWVSSLAQKGLAPATVRAAYLVLGQVFATTVVDGLIARSPCVGVKLPRDHHDDEMVFLDPGQIATLAQSIDDRYRALIFLASYGGLRAGELGALRVGRLNLLGGTVEVVESLSEVRGRLVTGPTKSGSRRSVTLPRFLAQMIGEHIDRYPSTDRYVFNSAEGGPVRHRNLSRRHFKPAVIRAGLPERMRFHDRDTPPPAFSSPKA